MALLSFANCGADFLPLAMVLPRYLLMTSSFVVFFLLDGVVSCFPDGMAEFSLVLTSSFQLSRKNLLRICGSNFTSPCRGK